MDVVILWAGFAGAWLLVLGPVYQAAVELREEEFERERLEEAARLVGEPPRMSGWLWVLPPIGYVAAVRRRNNYKHAVFHQLNIDDKRQLVHYIDKATGWYMVAAGAGLIAAAETWEIVEHYEWRGWTFWPILVVLVLFVMAYVGRCSERWKRLTAAEE